MTDLDELKSINDIEEQGKKNVLKYFDRIHDKLFTFNNILIAGYFALSKIVDKTPSKSILFPILNLIILIYIEYKMMEISRSEASFKKDLPNKLYNNYNLVTVYSFIAIASTSIVTIIFLYYLF